MLCFAQNELGSQCCQCLAFGWDDSKFSWNDLEHQPGKAHFHEILDLEPKDYWKNDVSLVWRR